MAKIATRRSEMTQGARETLNAFDDFLNDIFEVSTESLPPEFRGQGEFTSFHTLNKKLNKRAKRVKLDSHTPVQFATIDGERSVTVANADRLARINRYREQAESDTITYEEAHSDGDAQYNAMVEFTCQLVRWGALSEDDFDDEKMYC